MAKETGKDSNQITWLPITQDPTLRWRQWNVLYPSNVAVQTFSTPLPWDRDKWPMHRCILGVIQKSCLQGFILWSVKTHPLLPALCLCSSAQGEVTFGMTHWGSAPSWSAFLSPRTHHQINFSDVQPSFLVKPILLPAFYFWENWMVMDGIHGSPHLNRI